MTLVDSRRLPALLCFVALACALLVAVAPAGVAQDGGGEQELTITAHDGGGDYWFEAEGVEGRNPGFNLEPGVTYTVNFINEGQTPHNLHFGEPIEEVTALLNSGEEETLTFTVPDDASGTGEYWCDPHVSLGMAGALGFGEDPGAAPSGGGGDEPAANGDGEAADPETRLMLLVMAGVIGAVLVVMFMAAQRP